MLNWIPHVPDWIQQALFPLSRWLHIVCTSLLVGGTLFYEFVIPKAIADLKEETQLAVLGRVRWFFRNIVIFSTVTLVISGSLSMYHQWPLYNGKYHVVMPWVYLHLALGLLSLIVATAAMVRTRAPRQPLVWLRINFVILLIAIFVVALARHLRLIINYNNEKPANTTDVQR
jgi:uncharacterized membrane protein